MFRDCEKSEVKDLMVVVGDRMFIRKLRMKKTFLLPRSPCLNHSIHIELDFKDWKRKPLTSETTVYLARETENCQSSIHHLQINPPEEEKTGKNILYLGFAISVPLVVILLCCIAVLLQTLRRRPRKLEQKCEDLNPVYGIYAMYEEVDLTEATDYNEIYEGEEEEDGKGQLKDNNQFYE